MINRKIAPELKFIQDFQTGFPDCKNNIFHLVNSDQIFKLEIVWPEGGYSNSINKFNSVFGMDLLLSGTKNQDAGDIAESIDYLGGFVFKSSEFYSSNLTVFGLNKNFHLIYDILKKSITECYYNISELEIYKLRKLSELNINLDKTSYISNVDINISLLGIDHPYSQFLTHDIVQNINSQELNNFRRNSLINPYFIFTGSKDISLTSLYSNNSTFLSEKEFLFPINTKISDNFILKKDSKQNSIRMGKILPARTHEDYYKISLLNLVIGGFFGSRLMKTIREEKGLTYGIHSSLTPFRDFSLFKISSECNVKLTNNVKAEIYLELRKLQETIIPDNELMVAKNYMIGSLLRNFDGVFNISERLKASLDLNTQDNYYNNLIKNIHSITALELKACANNYFNLNTLNCTIVGEY